MKAYKRDINKEMDKLLVDIDNNFQEIIELNKPLIIYTISLVKYKPPITKEELFQESTIELWRICKKYKKINVSFTAYFCQDLKNYLINYIQRNQYVLTIPYKELRNKKYEELDIFVNTPTTENEQINEEDFTENYQGFDDDRLNNIKQLLTEDEWELLYKIAVEEYSLTDYGKEKKLTRAGARYRWTKLKQKLKTELNIKID